MNINVETAKDTLCKNILIYGFCKYQDKGCLFSHKRDVPGTDKDDATKSTLKKFNVNTPSFQPNGGSSATLLTQTPSAPSAPLMPLNPLNPLLSLVPLVPLSVAATSKFTGLSPRLKNIPVFVPSAISDESSAKLADEHVLTKRFNALTPSFTPLAVYEPVVPVTDSAVATALGTPINQLSNALNTGYFAGQNVAPPLADVFFGQSAPSYPLQYHHYAPPPPPRLAHRLEHDQTDAVHLCIDSALRERLHRQNEATLQTIPHSSLPEHVGLYHSLVPIDITYTPISHTYNVALAVYKVYSNSDGNAYAMRRLHLTAPISSKERLLVVHAWKKIKCANVVDIKDAFTTMAFGASSSLVVVYDYWPCALTLAATHAATKVVPESTMWSYLCQLVNAVRAVHAVGVAARHTLDASKIIVTNSSRLRLLAGALDDILDESERDVKSLQQQDYELLLKTMLSLCNVVDFPAATATATVFEPLLKIYSEKLVLALRLLAEPNMNIEEYVQTHLAIRLLDVMNGLEDAHDYTEATLLTELENARLVRLLAKIEFVANENVNVINSPHNVISMFRAHVFQHRDEFGRPAVDLARVICELNKLDAGIAERILLVSSDEKQCIVASYREIRDVIHGAFRRLIP